MNLNTHTQKVKDIATQIKEISKTKQKTIRFYRGGTNSTRQQNKNDSQLIDISELNNVLEINEKHKYVIVEPNVPMDKLIGETLKHGLIPPVITEFPGITCGGAVNGAALEASSFKYGQFNDSCLEYEIILGNGEILRASGENSPDIFYGISGSYGSLGLITLIKIRLIPVKHYVHLRFIPVSTESKTLDVINKLTKEGKYDFIEGIIFSKEKRIVIAGKFSDKKQLPIQTYSSFKDPWFYEHAQKIAVKNLEYEEIVPIKDYLFRYNRGAFWMGEYAFPFFHIPNNKFTKYILNPFLNTRKLYDGMHAVNMSQDYFIQDFYVPLKEAFSFIKYSSDKINIYPIWLCPVKPTIKPQKLSPHYLKTNLIIDIGIWGQTKKYLSDPIGINREFEKYSKNNNSRKMLYAHAYFTEEEFWKTYDKKWYEDLRSRYHADKVFPDIWKKVHVSEKYNTHKWKGIIKIMGETLTGKNLNS